MNRLPYSWQAILNAGKLEDYCLDPSHFRGRHKARVFHRVLGIDRGQASWLRTAILEGVGSKAVTVGQDAYGSRWQVDMAIARGRKEAVVRTVWIIRTGEQAPRFVTCWVL